jgi:hypothetical protein
MCGHGGGTGSSDDVVNGLNVVPPRNNFIYIYVCNGKQAREELLGPRMTFDMFGDHLDRWT